MGECNCPVKGQARGTARLFRRSPERCDNGAAPAVRRPFLGTAEGFVRALQSRSVADGYASLTKPFDATHGFALGAFVKAVAPEADH